MTGFRPATRKEAKPLIGLYSESGCGKTWSALLLARGFVGEAGVIGMIETEGGRGEAYVGRAPVGDYLVRPIREIFAPQEYGKAISEAEKAGLGALIVDSASHEWEGNGGVLAMAAANQAAGKTGVLVWQQPKIQHAQHFMLRLMQTPIPLVIICMRAKYPMEQKGSNWTRSQTLDPKQSDDILFEMFIHGWIDAQHRFRATKYTLPELASVIKDNEPIDIESGRALARWAAGTSSPLHGESPAPSRQPSAPHAGSGADESSPALPLGEAGASDDDSRLRFIAATRDHIKHAKDYEELGTWWNSDEQKQARRDFELSAAEIEDLKAFLVARLGHLKPKATA